VSYSQHGGGTSKTKGPNILNGWAAARAPGAIAAERSLN
jgi:hypothetical protein